MEGFAVLSGQYININNLTRGKGKSVADRRKKCTCGRKGKDANTMIHSA